MTSQVEVGGRKPKPLRKLWYVCDNGHELSAWEPLTRCVGMKHGRPCQGALRQVSGR